MYDYEDNVINYCPVIQLDMWIFILLGEYTFPQIKATYQASI